MVKTIDSLSKEEQALYEQAIDLIDIKKHKGFNRLTSIMAEISNSLYPKPQDDKYSTWEHLEKDYTFARGATELLQRVLIVIGQQEDILSNLMDKLQGDKKGDFKVGK